jgi:hypothetical protein
MDRHLRDAYFAGLIDGEGHIGFSSSGYRQVPMVQVKMTCKKTIYALKEHFGVGYIYAEHPEKKHYKPQWKWRASCASSVKVLAAITPYLITKAEAAQAILDSPPTAKGSRLFVPSSTD